MENKDQQNGKVQEGQPSSNQNQKHHGEERQKTDNSIDVTQGNKSGGYSQDSGNLENLDEQIKGSDADHAKTDSDQ